MKVRKILIWGICLITFISLIFNLKYFQKTSSDNTVVKVVDGDTFELGSGRRVRLLGVDAPEFDRCYGEEATQKLTSLILNKPVEIKESVPEKYGRDMALVYQGKNLVNLVMMEDGFARPDYRANSKRDDLTVAYKTALDQKKGLWGQCIVDKAKDNCTIKGNIDFATYEKFYHLPNCRHYNETILNLAYGEQWFCTEKEAQTAGFKKSASCP